MKRKYGMNFKRLIILPFFIAMFIIMFPLSTIAQPPPEEKAKDSGSQLQELASKVKELDNTVKNERSIRNRVLNWVIPVAMVIICLFVYQRFIKKRTSVQEFRLQRSEFSKMQKQLGDLQSQYKQISESQIQFEKTMESMKAENINQTLLAGINTWNLTLQEMRAVISYLDELNENLPQFPTQDSIVQAIASEVNPKFETIVSNIRNIIEPFAKNWNSSLSKIQESLDMLPDRIREEGAQKPTTPEGEIPPSPPVKEEHVSEPQTPEGEPTEIDTAWSPFLEFIKQHFKPNNVSLVEQLIKQTLSEKRDPATVHRCFEIFAKVTGVIYRESILRPEDVDFDDFVNRFQEQLQLRIYGLDAEGHQWKNLSPRPKALVGEKLEPESPQREIYDKKLNKMLRTGKPQAGQVIAVLSPGIESTYRPEWNIPPEVAIYGENK